MCVLQVVFPTTRRQRSEKILPLFSVSEFDIANMHNAPYTKSSKTGAVAIVIAMLPVGGCHRQGGGRAAKSAGVSAFQGF